MKRLDHTKVKRCVQCGVWFSHRKASGQVYHSARWAEKVTCTNRCHALRRWARDAEPINERFWRQVAKGQKSKCWPYTGAARDRKGYGGFHWKDKKMMRAHRMAWILTNGPIDEGLVVTHRCDNKVCCNPYHLRLGTVADNNADSFARTDRVSRNRDTGHHATRWNSAQVTDIIQRYNALPKGPNGGRKQGVVSALAREFDTTLAGLLSLIGHARNAHK